jgi:hypothetical protein
MDRKQIFDVIELGKAYDDAELNRILIVRMRSFLICLTNSLTAALPENC